ncbi:putative receptor protein kinase ZmPK1 [Olea europaea var. sylvestris]|uniref:putative receptor protein kinase ZmPK1 n=1 Tax=Olea europaea var. sylvestris TaxID=158386 RepID=UPI000C1D0411|nr:putative receptor protein kinase ZmPK1 [Olea europaea var. sylvestris]
MFLQILFWQSFDVPTDTLLPFQTLTKNKRLTSTLRKGSYGSGYFNLNFGSDNVLRLILDTPDTSSNYWPNPDFDVYRNGRTNYNSSRVAFLDDMGRFLSSDQLQINASDMGYGIKRRMTIDYDGNLRIYSLINSTGLWEITWQALGQPCSVRGVCGRNAVCVYAPDPRCACPPGFEVNDLSDWNAGCKATFNETLLRSRQVKFVEIPHVDFYGFDLNATSPLTLESCREMCASDFRCLAFSYRILGQGFCYVKSAHLNGYETPEFPASIYIKVPNSLQPPNPSILYESRRMCGSAEAEQIIGSPSMYDFVPKRVKWIYI